MAEQQAEKHAGPRDVRSFIRRPVAAVLACAAVLLSTAIASAAAQDHRPAVRDTVVVMGEVVISDSVRAFRPESLRIRRLAAEPGAADRGATVAELLAGSSLIDVRRGGATGPATASMRGAGATGTPVVMDGFRLADPQTGVVDLSMIPLALVEHVELVHGPSGRSDALGGTIVLQSKRPSRVRDAASAAAGSFGRRTLSLSAGGRRSGLEGSVAASTSRVDGDFPYENTAAFPSRREIRHGAGRQTVSVSMAGRMTIPDGSVRLLTWLSDAVRGVPGPANAAGSGAVLGDRLLRAQLGARSRFRGVMWDVGVATTRSERDYHHPDEGERSFDGSVTSFQGGLSRVPGGRWLFESTAQWNRERARFSESVVRSVAAFDAGLVGVVGPAVLETGLEISGARSPGGHSTGGQAGSELARAAASSLETVILPSAGARIELGGGLAARISAARSFRRPTLNELYWVPGGNPDLRAERGWMVDAGLAADRSLLGLDWAVDAGIYTGRITDRITWQPSLAGAAVRVWRPVNTGLVELRGAEAGMEGRFAGRSGIWTLSLHAGRTETLDRTNRDARSWGHQIRYVPTASAVWSLGYERRGWYARLGSRWTGVRYTTTDESLHLDPYRTTTLAAGHRLRTNTVSIRLGVAIENLENASWQVMRLYPMPPRHASFTLSVTSKASDS